MSSSINSNSKKSILMIWYIFLLFSSIVTFAAYIGLVKTTKTYFNANTYVLLIVVCHICSLAIYYFYLKSNSAIAYFLYFSTISSPMIIFLSTVVLIGLNILNPDGLFQNFFTVIIGVSIIVFYIFIFEANNYSAISG